MTKTPEEIKIIELRLEVTDETSLIDLRLNSNHYAQNYFRENIETIDQIAIDPDEERRRKRLAQFYQQCECEAIRLKKLEKDNE